MSSSSSQTFLDTVLDALVDPVLMTDADGVVTGANAAAIDRLGAGKYVGVALAEQASRGEVLSEQGTRLGWSEHPVALALATRQPVTRTVIVAPPAAFPTRFRMTTVPLESDGRLIGTISVLHPPASVAATVAAVASDSDLSDRAARLEAIVNLVSDAVFVVDRDGRLLYHNAVGARLLGLPQNVTLDERARRLQVRDADGGMVGPEDFPSMRALAGETMAGVPLLITDPAGETRHVVTGAHPLRRSDGEIYAAVVTMKDTTDEVRAREELEAARENAEEANHLKDQFIAALSHELRTPLQPILGWTEVLRRHGSLDAITTQALEAIRRNIRQQVRLVDDLLDLSRIVHGKLALRFESFDLREQVRAAVEPFEEAAALRRVRLTLTLPPEPVMMWGDGARIQQIVTNLISNAVKFTPAGGQIAAQLVAGDTQALIEVEDSGEGIAPEELAVIFEPFRQGGASRRRGGLGIGLDLVKRLTELHGGAVEAVSEGHGYGARFSVRLPLRFGRTTPPSAAVPVARRLLRREILVIEDNPDTREVLKFMLEAEGAHVETADSGQEGIRLARASRPSVILCDIGLPDVDGLEVARRIRRVAALDGSRLIALTGYGQPEDVQHALDAGFEAHLTKPINLDQLLELLAGS